MNVPIRKGMALRHENRVYFIEDFHERHTGKQRPTVHVHLRDVLDGRHVDRTLDELTPLQTVELAVHAMQYLYHRGGKFVFMDNQTYDEHEMDHKQLEGLEPFLAEGQEVRVVCLDGRPVKLDVPEIVTLKVTSTAAPSHSVGNTGGVPKEAVLENGLTVHVPLFIKNGDMIRVDTRSKSYAGKETHA